MKTKRLQVLLVEDNDLFRDSLSELLQLDGRLEVAGTAADGDQALELVERLSPGAVLMDLSLPTISGYEAMRRIAERHPDTFVVGMSTFDEDEVAGRLYAAGARGYVRKDLAPEAVVDTLLGLAAGRE